MLWLGVLTCRLPNVLRSLQLGDLVDQLKLTDVWLLIEKVSITHTTTHHIR